MNNPSSLIASAATQSLPRNTELPFYGFLRHFAPRNNVLVGMLALTLSSPVLAQTDLTTPSVPVQQETAKPARNNSGEPIEITAGKSVEWLRNDQKYVARENVIIKQGTVTITSDLATADYREGAKSSMEIWQLTAEGNVKIITDGNTATGDKAVYNIDEAVATLTGNDLKLVSPDQTVTATERMEYHPDLRQAKAIGNAKVVRAKDTLSANTITATFKNDSAAKTEPADGSIAGTGNLEKIEASGNVVIVTPTETLRGSKGVYDATTNIAELVGKVKIERGPNILEGEKAEVNLTNNVSKMYGSNTEDGRVRGLFFPGSEKKPGDAPKSANPAAGNPSAPVAPPANPATVAPDTKTAE
jgi:lipopolysaccharide export system protein LptA